jgi:hypothetical protein
MMFFANFNPGFKRLEAICRCSMTVNRVDVRKSNAMFAKF